MTTEINHTPDEAYFQWLYHFIGVLSDLNINNTHWLLAEQLHNKTFEWSVSNDDNRAMDGIQLRETFFKETGVSVVNSDRPCSFLEMLIALAIRMNFEENVDPQFGVGVWFWRMMENVGLDEFNDDMYTSAQDARDLVDGIVDNITYRNYNQNGAGGLFPLQHMNHQEDQRNVELWYQMQTWMIENLES